MVENRLNVEYLLQAVMEFRDACLHERLSLTNGPNLFSYFRQTLVGEIWDEFDTIHRNDPHTMNGFNAAQN